MRSAIAQVYIFAILLYPLLQAAKLVKLKRSPLEIGFVSFLENSVLRKVLNQTATSEQSIESIDTKSHHHHNIIHRWVPGYVRQHAFIPAHVDHLFVPNQVSSPAIVVTHQDVVLVEPEVYHVYRSHYGGFGVGTDVGGQGAGHGFHVIYNV